MNQEVEVKARRWPGRSISVARPDHADIPIVLGEEVADGEKLSVTLLGLGQAQVGMWSSIATVSS